MNMPKRQALASARPIADRWDPPPATWQEMGWHFVDWAQKQLWAVDDCPGMAYVRRGGLNDETIEHFRLGWNCQETSHGAHHWGFEGWNKVHLPRGMVIPGRVSGDLWYVKLRCFDENRAPANRKPKYLQIRGSKSAPFGADDLCADGRPLLLCEGERDSMLAHQELSKLAHVITFGGAGKRITGGWLTYLLPYQLILAAYDVDQTGFPGARRLVEQSRRVAHVRVPFGDDLTDFHQQGGDLRSWLSFHLERLGVPLDLTAHSQGRNLSSDCLPDDSPDARKNSVPEASDDDWLDTVLAQLPITIDELPELTSRYPGLDTRLTWPEGSSGLVLLVGRR